MICIVAFVIFGILSIFSVKYRSYAKKSFECVFRMITLRPCESHFDEQIKMKLTVKSAKVSRRLSGFIYDNFKLISWAFTLLLVGSLGFIIIYLITGVCTSCVNNVCK